MNTKLVARYVSVGASIVTAALLYGCDSGSSENSGGAGGSGSTTGEPSTTSTTVTTGTTDPSTTTSTGSGNPGGIELIDNMEDGDGSIINAAGRKGAWFTYNDTTAAGKQTPVAGAPFTMAKITGSPVAGSAYGAATVGSGFTTWGAGMGLDLNNDGKAKGAYSASAYKGITFYAMVGPTADLAGKSIRFNVVDKNSAPEGGICDASGAVPAKQCSDAFGADLALTTSWQQFSFTWAQLKQLGWGLPVSTGVATDALYSIQFKAAQSTSFDIIVDDIAFLL